MRFSTLYKSAALVLILILVGSNLIIPGEDSTMYSRFEDAETDLNPPGIDSDGDGLKDILEDINHNGIIDGSEHYPTDPYNPDTDSDGIEDGIEYDYWSDRRVDRVNIPYWIGRYTVGLEDAIKTLEILNPYSDLDQDGIMNLMDPDSDNDGIIDGDELDNLTDPADPDSDHDGVPDDRDTSHGEIIDLDGNGLDDDWEAFYGVSDPDSDPDGDGLVNREEFDLVRFPRSYDHFIGRIGAPGYEEITAAEDPDRLMFTVDLSDPRYMPLYYFTRLDGDEWFYSSSDIFTPASPPGTRSSADFDLNGFWTGPLPSTSAGIVNVTGPISPVYPQGESSDTEFVGDVLWTGKPIQNYTLDIVRPSVTGLDLTILNDTEGPPDGYVTIPPYLPKEVEDLSRSWAGSTVNATPLKTTLALVEALWERCSYSPQSSFGIGEDDPVSHFLFVTNRGPSLDFASTLAVMVRVHGIPSRLVAGYALGEEIEGGRAYRQGHMHVWTEIYLKDYGWVQIEATPHASGSSGGSGIEADGIDPYVFGPNGGDGGGTLKGSGKESLDPLADYDGDGLITLTEWEIGTNPRVWDSDGDSLSDGDEYYNHHTNASNPDSDGDFLYDDQEINIYGTDANNPDTDGGGVDDGTEISCGMDPFDDSDDRLLTDADMDGLDDDDEVIFGTYALNPDSDGDGIIDGSEVYSYRTDPTDPDTDNDTIPDGLEVDPENGWNFTDPTRPDTDGDGLDDSEERSFGSNPRLHDTDLDGLSDKEEKLLGTDPLDPDSDDDGLSDGKERRNKRGLVSNPMKSDTDGDGRSDGFEMWNGLYPNGTDEADVGLDQDGDMILDRFEIALGTGIDDPDSDGDGLSDGYEHHDLGTDSLSNDTDGDGLNDDIEVLILFTDPLQPDTDLDNITDPEELSSGLYPRSPDTDLDRLPDGLEIDMGTDPMRSDSDGGGIGDGLEVILGRDPLDPGDDFPMEDRDGDGLLDVEEDRYGTDIDDPDTDGDGLLDGHEVKVLLTNATNPDTDEDGLWDGEEVYEGKYGYITDPLEPDTDRDGLTDGDEVMSWFSSPVVNDTDRDGIMDGEEKLLGTDPLDPDSDGDGLLDGEEVRLGSDPLRSDTDEGGAVDGIEHDRGGDVLDPSDDVLYMDTDGDGLLDVEEIENGTDPKKKDTDGDGLWDPVELNGDTGYFTDPLDPDMDNDTILDGEEVLPGNDGYVTHPNSTDTDGDGLLDNEEIAGTAGQPSHPSLKDGDSDGLSDPVELFTSGTDPLNDDTDGDGLPDGWVDGWRDRPEDGKMNPGEYEDRDLDGFVDPGDWNGGAGPGETDPLDPDTDDGGVDDGYEVFYGILFEGSSDPLILWDDGIIKDSDGDGLTDMEENGTGYDSLWNDPDTDNDLMWDGHDITVDGVFHPGELTPHNGYDNTTDPNYWDSDGDRLSDYEEYEYGTDPNDVDTDNDGVWDGHSFLLTQGELDDSYDYGPTDPLNPDSDGDGLWDGGNIDMSPSGGTFHYGESEPGTDPNNPDTDGDGLTDYEEFMEYHTDPLVADTDGGMMPDGLEISLSIDLSISLNPLDPADDDLFMDNDSDGLLNGRERFELYYNRSEIDWDGNGKLNFYPCWYLNDTDGDGLDDGDEVLIFRTNPLMTDTDSDGLPDLAEIREYGTNPKLADSDGDALTDYTEVNQEYEVTEVDWTGDGINDNRTDPNNPDTDSDSLMDGQEALHRDPPWNPLDRGDPGTGTFPLRDAKVFIDRAPESIRKDPEDRESRFKVEGHVLDDDGDPLQGIRVSVLLVESGTDSGTVLSMERNPNVIVGTGRTDSNGVFIITCSPTHEGPAGISELFVVSGDSIVKGIVYPPAVSHGISIPVYTGSRMEIDILKGPYSTGSILRVDGHLVDLGGRGISGGRLFVSSGMSDQFSIDTEGNGAFSFNLLIPDEPGEVHLNISYSGGDYITPTAVELTLIASDGPSLTVELSDSIVLIGGRIFVNGTLIGGSPDGEVNITITSASDSETVLTMDPDLAGGDYTVEVQISPSLFSSGDYLVAVTYEAAGGVRVVNSAPSFTVVDEPFIALRESRIFRGESSTLSFRIRTAGGRSLAGEIIRISFPEAEWAVEMVSVTNETGWAVFMVEAPQGIRLGPVIIAAEQLSPDGETVVSRVHFDIDLISSVYFADMDVPDELILTRPIRITGRMVDDSGAGIDGAPLKLIIGPEEVGLDYFTMEGGWFEITYTVSKFLPTGVTELHLRFVDMVDDRAGHYDILDSLNIVTIRSGTFLESDLSKDGGNITLLVTLRDARGDPVGRAGIQIGIGVEFETFYTDETGNISLVMEDAAEGDDIRIFFPGDSGRYLLPSSANVTVPVNVKVDRSGMIIRAVSITIAVVMLIILAVWGGSKLINLKKEMDTRHIRETHKESLYDFEPGDRAQREIMKAYRTTLEGLDQKGVKRPPSMTPHEFYRRLRKGSLGIGMDDVKDITEIFGEARYSDHRMTPLTMSRALSLEKKIRESVIDTMSEEDTAALKEAILEVEEPAERRVTSRVKVDPSEDLKTLLGDKEVRD